MGEEEIKQQNGWFQRHVLDSLNSVNTEIIRLRDSLSAIHKRIDVDMKESANEFGIVRSRIGRIETVLGLYKWLMGGLVISLIGLVISLLLYVVRTP